MSYQGRGGVMQLMDFLSVLNGGNGGNYQRFAAGEVADQTAQINARKQMLAEQEYGDKNLGATNRAEARKVPAQYINNQGVDGNPDYTTYEQSRAPQTTQELRQGILRQSVLGGDGGGAYLDESQDLGMLKMIMDSQFQKVGDSLYNTETGAVDYQEEPDNIRTLRELMVNPEMRAVDLDRKRAGAINLGGDTSPTVLTEEQKVNAGLPPEAVVQVDSKGKITVVDDKRLPEHMLKSGGFYDRMSNVNTILDTHKVNYPDFDPTSIMSKLGSIPGGNYIMSTEMQQYKNASDEWIRAKLRKESGAVIGADEMQTEYETYFPQPGDSAETIKQKTQLRDEATKSMRKMSGRKPTKKTISWDDM